MVSPRRFPSAHRLSSTTLVLGFVIGSCLPATALAAPSEQPAPTAAPAVESQPQPAAQPAAQTGAQPAAQPGAQPGAQPAAQAQPPAPVYQPPPAQPVPPKPPNRNRGLGLMISGYSVFGFAYIISAITATIMIDTGNGEIGRPLLIPAVGPFVAASRSRTAVGGFGLAFSGVAQLVGLGMGVGGTVVFAKSRRQAELSAAPGGLRLRF